MSEKKILGDFKKALTDAKTKHGGITPFFGAVASSVKKEDVKDEDDTIWGSVIKRLLILKIADKSDLIVNDNFIDHFAKNHGINIKEVKSKYEPDKEPKLSNFDKWRLHLIKLIFLLTSSYSKQVSKDFIIPVNLLYEVKDFEDKREVIELLRGLINKSNDISLDDGEKVLFPKEKINEKLKFILCKIVSKDREMIEGDNFFECQNNYDDCKYQSGGECTCEKIFVTAGEIRWLKELLWWSLRYDIPIYPNSNELAHCLSYFIDPIVHKDVRDNDLMKIAETITEENESGCNKNLVDLFEAIKKNRENKEKEGVFSSEKTFEISHIVIDEVVKYLFSIKKTQMPLVVTTNYDTMIEDAIKKYIDANKKGDKNVKYRVIFPIIILQSDSNSYTPADISWVCLEHSPYAFNNQNQVFKIQGKLNIEREFDLYDGTPTLLKLHGNPLFDISNIKEDLKDFIIDDNTKIKHFMVLTESDYLKSLLLKLHEADMQKLLFGIKRSYWFLGYSVSDWNVRTIIYHSLNKFKHSANDVSRKKPKGDKNDEESNNQIQFNILAPHQDSYNQAFLSNLDIITHHNDLRSFKTLLNE